jgi:hypothetical protein
MKKKWEITVLYKDCESKQEEKALLKEFQQLLRGVSCGSSPGGRIKVYSIKEPPKHRMFPVVDPAADQMLEALRTVLPVMQRRHMSYDLTNLVTVAIDRALKARR